MDVPTGIRHGGFILPLGTYLRRRLREGIGRDETVAKEVLEEWHSKLQIVRDFAKGRQVGTYADAFRGAVMDITEVQRLRSGRRMK